VGDRVYKRWTFGRIIKRLLLVAAMVVIVLNWTWGKIPKQPPMPYGKIATVGDLKIHYVEKPGADPPVVMIHGLPGTWGDWNAVTTQLAGRHTLAIDRPGFAYSNGDYVPFDDQLVAIHALTKQLRMKDPVIAGHSYGGTLALGYAAKYPKETHSIVLVDAAAPPDDVSAFTKVQAQLVKVLQVPVIKQVADATFSQALRTSSADSGDKVAFDPNPVNPEHKKRLLELNMQSDDLKAYAGEILNLGDVFNSLDPKIKTIKTRAFIIQGREDKDVEPQTATTLKSELPHSSLLMLSGGHMQPYVHPREVASQIKLASR
jgi:pimeloyl-ACP methyl ester carboxylesterase